MRPDVDPDPPLGAGGAEFPSTGDDALDALIAGLRDQVASAREQLDAWDVGPGEAALSPRLRPRRRHPRLRLRSSTARTVTGGWRTAFEQRASEAVPPIDEVTRDRLAAIEAELRAAVPDPSASTPARDVIASLQHAADRLRAAAEEELGRLEAEDHATATPPRRRETHPPPRRTPSPSSLPPRAPGPSG
jgi:hypothetical protein